MLSYYKKAVEEGATVLTGGGIPEMPAELAGGAWVQPTIWTGLPGTAAVVNEEIFGPCCHIRPFDTEEEAIRLANSTPYGLAAAVWTENLSRAHRVAAQMDASTRGNPIPAGTACGLPLILSFSRKGRRNGRITLCARDRARTPLPLRERGRGEG